MERPELAAPERSDPWHAGGDRVSGTAREKFMAERGPVGRAIDWIGRVLASPPFFTTFLGLHLLWVLLNIRVVPGLEPWDPYPFTFLATIASVEAPLVALLVLMRQQRDRIVEEIRDEAILQVSLHVEREGSELLRMMGAVGERLEVEFDNAEVLAELQKELDPEALMSSMEEAEEEPPGH